MAKIASQADSAGGLGGPNAELTILGDDHGTLWKEGIRESRESNA